MLSLQLDLINNVRGAIDTLMQMSTACALILLVNITRPFLQYGKRLLSDCLIMPKH